MTNKYTLSNGKEVKVTAKNKRVVKKPLGEHYAYTITIEVDDKLFKTTFHDSIASYRVGFSVCKEMIDTAVYCVIMDYDSYDYNPDEDDFIRVYGYDPEGKEGHRVYKVCKATFDALNAMFSRSELEELYNLVDGDNK